MTSIGFRAPGTLSPPVLPRAAAQAREQLTVPRPVAAPAATWARLGRVEMHSAASYLVVWSAVLFVVLLAVELLTYVVLGALGVLSSVSQALALLSSRDPASGLVPVLQPQHVLPLLVVIALCVSGLFLVAMLGLLLVHNAATSLTGGIRVRVRPETLRRSSGGGSRQKARFGPL